MPLLTPLLPSRRKDFYPPSSSSSSSNSQSTEFTLNSIRAAASARSARLRKAASVHASVPANANININSANNSNKRTMSSVKAELPSSKHFGTSRHHSNRRGDRVRSGVSEYNSADPERTRSGLGIFTKKNSKSRSSSTTSGSFSRLTFNPRSESSFGRLTLRGTTRKVDPTVPYKAITDTDVRGYEKIGGGNEKYDDANGLPRKKSGVILPTEEQLREHRPKGGVILPYDLEPKSSGSGYTPKGWNEAAKMGGRFISFDQPSTYNNYYNFNVTTDLGNRIGGGEGGGGKGGGNIARFISFDDPGSTKNTNKWDTVPLQTERIISFDAAPKTIQGLPPSRPMSPLQPKVSKMRQPQSLRDFRRSPSSRIEQDSAVASRKSSIKQMSGRIQRKSSISTTTTSTTTPGEYKTIDTNGREVTHAHLSHRSKATTTNDLCGHCGHCKERNWPADQTATMTEDGRFYLSGTFMRYDEFTRRVGFCTAFWLIQRPGATLDRGSAMRWGLIEKSDDKSRVSTLYRPLIRLFLADRDEHGFQEGQYYGTTDISSAARRSFSKIALHTLTLDSLKVLVEWTRRVKQNNYKLNTPQFDDADKITAVNALDAIDTFCRDNPGRVVGPLPKHSRRTAQ